jgi:hypothetical protein
MKHFKYQILFLCCLLVNSICFATSGYFQYDQKAFNKEVLPFTFSKKLPVVEVKIQGKNFHLIVDTGAPNATIALKPSALRDINVNYLESKKHLLDIHGQSYEEKEYEIPELTIGKLKLVNMIASEELRTFVPADGIIGNRVLKEFYFLFDYKDLKVTFFTKGNYPLELNMDQWQKVHFEYDDYDKRVGIILTAQIPELKRQLKLCLDSGSSAFDNGKPCGMLLKKYMPELPEEVRAVEYNQVMIDGLALGSTSFRVYDYPEPPIDGFMGFNFFNNYKVFVDFDKKVLFTKKY